MWIKIFFTIGLLLVGVLQSYSQANKRYDYSLGYLELDIGLAYPIHLNNEFSKEMINPFASNAGFRFAGYLDKDNNLALGGIIGGYDYGLNDQKFEEIISGLVAEYGVLSFGDIFINDWSEWDFGLFFHGSKDLTERFLFTGDVGGGIMLSSRRQAIYSYADNAFVYNVNSKGNRGQFVTGELGLNYLFYPKNRAYIGVAYEMTYGTMPVNYEVRYGTGNDISVYDSYNYSNTFTVWRHRLKLKIRFDFSVFH